MSPKSFFSAFFLAALLPSAAQAQWQFSGGFGLRHVQTAEYAPGGAKLVTERGWLPGVQLRAERPIGDWLLALHGLLHGGDIDYDGRLQNGAPFRTETDTRQSRLGVELSHALNPSLQFVAGLEWDYWNRRIRGHSGVLGLSERYTSWRLLGGVDFDALRTNGGVLRARTMLVASSPEKLRVRFDNDLFDETRFSTKAGIGMRIGFTFVPSAAPAMTLGLEFDWLRVPRSGDALLRQGGSAAGSLAQPEHVRRGVDVYVRYRF